MGICGYFGQILLFGPFYAYFLWISWGLGVEWECSQPTFLNPKLNPQSELRISSHIAVCDALIAKTRRPKSLYDHAETSIYAKIACGIGYAVGCIYAKIAYDFTSKINHNMRFSHRVWSMRLGAYMRKSHTILRAKLFIICCFRMCFRGCWYEHFLENCTCTNRLPQATREG